MYNSMPVKGKLISSLHNCWYLRDNRDLNLSAQKRTIGILPFEPWSWLYTMISNAIVQCCYWLQNGAYFCRSKSLWLQKEILKKAAWYWLLLLATGLNKKSLLCTKCNQKFILICYWNIEKCVRFSGLAVMLVSWIFSFISFIFLFLRNCCLLFFTRLQNCGKLPIDVEVELLHKIGYQGNCLWSLNW